VDADLEVCNVLELDEGGSPVNANEARSERRNTSGPIATGPTKWIRRSRSGNLTGHGARAEDSARCPDPAAHARV